MSQEQPVNPANAEFMYWAEELLRKLVGLPAATTLSPAQIRRNIIALKIPQHQMQPRFEGAISRCERDIETYMHLIKELRAETKTEARNPQKQSRASREARSNFFAYLYEMEYDNERQRKALQNLSDAFFASEKSLDLMVDIVSRDTNLSIKNKENKWIQNPLISQFSNADKRSQFYVIGYLKRHWELAEEMHVELKKENRLVRVREQFKMLLDLKNDRDIRQEKAQQEGGQTPPSPSQE